MEDAGVLHRVGRCNWLCHRDACRPCRRSSAGQHRGQQQHTDFDRRELPQRSTVTCSVGSLAYRLRKRRANPAQGLLSRIIRRPVVLNQSQFSRRKIDRASAISGKPVRHVHSMLCEQHGEGERIRATAPNLEQLPTVDSEVATDVTIAMQFKALEFVFKPLSWRRSAMHRRWLLNRHRLAATLSFCAAPTSERLASNSCACCSSHAAR